MSIVREGWLAALGQMGKATGAIRAGNFGRAGQLFSGSSQSRISPVLSLVKVPEQDLA